MAHKRGKRLNAVGATILKEKAFGATSANKIDSEQSVKESVPASGKFQARVAHRVAWTLSSNWRYPNRHNEGNAGQVRGNGEIWDLVVTFLPSAVRSPTFGSDRRGHPWSQVLFFREDSESRPPFERMGSDNRFTVIL